ncbi:MAG TPA: hypothetical protein DEH78_04395, partial [Solibacterales bacterium]|nr:hypothetical protein [Bryobacterales bacterium]
MLNRLIERLFPGRLLARRERQWWLAAILLAPAAMLPGLFTGPPAIFGGITHVEHDRAGFLNIARKHLAERGVNTEGWKDTLRFVEDVDVERYLANRDAQWQARLRKHAPPIVALASFQPRSGGGSADVHLDIHGKPAGFALVQVTAQGVSASAQGTPVEVARAALAARLGADLPLFRLGEPEVTLVGREGGIPTQRFVWKTVPPGMAELEVRFRVDVRGATVLAELGELKLDAQYAAAHRPGRTFQTAIGWFFVFYATVLIIAVLVRYIKRSLQKEISHPRTIGIAFFFGATFFLYAAASDQLLAIRDTGGAPIAIIYLLAAIIYLIMGLLIGSAYSASEGELRESYPGKLTSLDSVLSGRPFSRNAAASFLLGVVIAAWMILFHEALRWTMPTPANFGGGEMLGLFVYSRFPSLVSFATLPIGAIMESLTLLLPIALLQRFFKSRRTLLCVVTPLALAASVGFTLAQASQSGLPLGATIAQALVKTAGLFAAFFWVDLFAAIVSHSVHSLIVFLLPVVRITPSGANEALLQLAVALLVLLAYAVALFRSRPVRDEEVRPQYARFLAERLSLESEVAAAREAQLRLLPTEPPRIEGLAIAAICRAADEVGGDFYDFFELDSGEVAVVIGGGNIFR